MPNYGMTPEEMQVLKDMFKDSPNTLKEMFGHARQASLQDTLGKPLAQDIVNASSKAGSSAAQSAQTLSKLAPPITDLVPTQGNALVAQGEKALATQGSKALAPVAEAAAASGGEGVGGLLSKLLGKASSVAAKSSIPVALLYPSSTANPRDAQGEPVPTLPGNVPDAGTSIAKGPDITRTPPTPMQTSWPSPLLLNEMNPPSPLMPQGDVLSIAESIGLNAAGQPKGMGSYDLEKLMQERAGELSDAEGSRNRLQLIAMLGEAGDQIGKGFAGAKTDPEFYRKLLGMSQQPIDDTLRNQKAQRIAMDDYVAKQGADPKSDLSRATQNLFLQAVKEAGMAPESFGNIANMSAANLDKMMAGVMNMAARRVMSESNMLRSQELNMDRDEKRYLTAVDTFTKAIDNTKSGNMAKLNARSQAADRALTLFDRFPDYKIPNAETYELVGAIAGLILQGQRIPLELLKDIVPSSWMGDKNRIITYLTNHPQKLNQPDFLKNMHATALREKTQANVNMIEDTMANAKAKRIGLEPFGEAGDRAYYTSTASYLHAEPEDVKKLEKASPSEFKAIAKSILAKRGIVEEVEALKRYKESIGESEPSSGAGLAPDKMKRLKELQAKKAAGTLGK
jgi:hypothetical protein